ncbi:MAG TPA: AprI/Inh family metalloprotease inhibitor [Devosia sp.]|nr:AprI/Inh family metalloprotease inhibitor [Devosia sp.]
MTSWRRTCVSLTLAGAAALALTGCASSRITTSNVAAPEQLQPVPSSQVASTNLPSIGGAVSPQQMPSGPLIAPGSATAQQINPALSGQPVLGGNQPMQTAGGRNLSGGLSVDGLAGNWTIMSSGNQCSVTLTTAAQSGTRYGASAPGCTLGGLGGVSAWQLAGSQLQLFDQGGKMIAAMILSGNRFIGTLAGGQGISMVG